MSDAFFGQRRLTDALAIRGALVLPGDQPPELGHDTVRIPVRVVWRDDDAAPAWTTEGAGGAATTGPSASAARPAQDAAGASKPDETRLAKPQAVPDHGFSPLDPVGSYLRINERLDRMSSASDPTARKGAPVIATGRDNTDMQDPTAPVPVLDGPGVPVKGARGPMVRPTGFPPEFFVQQGLADRHAIKRAFSAGSKWGAGNALMEGSIKT